MLCAPVFIFISGSSALLGCPHCGLSIWLSLLAIFNTLFFMPFFFSTRKQKKTWKYSKVVIFVWLRKWPPTITKCTKHTERFSLKSRPLELLGPSTPVWSPNPQHTQVSALFVWPPSFTRGTYNPHQLLVKIRGISLVLAACPTCVLDTLLITRIPTDEEPLCGNAVVYTVCCRHHHHHHHHHHHIHFTSFSSYNDYKLNLYLTCFQWGFIAQLVEHRTGITEVMGSNPIGASEFFLGFICNWLNVLRNCKDHFHLYSLSSVHSNDLYHILIYIISPSPSPSPSPSKFWWSFLVSFVVVLLEALVCMLRETEILSSRLTVVKSNKWVILSCTIIWHDVYVI